MYTLGKPHLFYYNLNKQEFNIDTQRNGESIRRKWSPINISIGSSDRIYLKHISFGICTHPFNPEGVSFNRKPFSKLKENEYGIAFKGTPIKFKDWENLATDTNPVDMSTRKMMNRRGAEVSYPFIVKRLKAEGLYELAKQSLEESGINALTISRTLPKYRTVYDGREKHFVPMPIYAMQLSPNSSHIRILFNEKQTVRSWARHHFMLNPQWETELGV